MNKFLAPLAVLGVVTLFALLVLQFRSENFTAALTFGPTERTELYGDGSAFFDLARNEPAGCVPTCEAKVYLINTSVTPNIRAYNPCAMCFGDGVCESKGGTKVGEPTAKNLCCNTFCGGGSSYQCSASKTVTFSPDAADPAYVPFCPQPCSQLGVPCCENIGDTPEEVNDFILRGEGQACGTRACTKCLETTSISDFSCSESLSATCADCSLCRPYLTPRVDPVTGATYSNRCEDPAFLAIHHVEVETMRRVCACGAGNSSNSSNSSTMSTTSASSDPYNGSCSNGWLTVDLDCDRVDKYGNVCVISQDTDSGGSSGGNIGGDIGGVPTSSAASTTGGTNGGVNGGTSGGTSGGTTGGSPCVGGNCSSTSAVSSVLSQASSLSSLTSSRSSSSSSLGPCGGTQSNPQCSGSCPNGQSCGVVATVGIDGFTCGCRSSFSSSSSSSNGSVGHSSSFSVNASNSFSFSQPNSSANSTSFSFSTSFPGSSSFSFSGIPCGGVQSNPLCSGVCPSGYFCGVISTTGTDSFNCGCKPFTNSSSVSFTSSASFSFNQSSQSFSFGGSTPTSSSFGFSGSSQSFITGFSSSAFSFSNSFSNSFSGNSSSFGFNPSSSSQFFAFNSSSSFFDTFSSSFSARFNLQCGNNVVEPPEQCDDGNNRPNDGCSAFCTFDGPGCSADFECASGRCINGSCYPCTTDDECSVGRCVNNTCQIPTIVAAAPICGNGALEPPEECDDGNTRDQDGCTSTCLLEVGICGDGIVQKLLGEQCEASRHNSALPYSCVNCRFTSSLCGNGIVDAGEECDLGQKNSTSPNAPCRPDCSRSRCGDGIIDAAELCDDGNNRSSDGCDRFCKTENGISKQVASVFGNQTVNFPSQNTAQPLPFQLPLANLQPLIQSQGPIGDTGPAAVAALAAGAGSGIAWVRRKRR